MAMSFVKCLEDSTECGHVLKTTNASNMKFHLSSSHGIDGKTEAVARRLQGSQRQAKIDKYSEGNCFSPADKLLLAIAESFLEFRVVEQRWFQALSALA